MRYKTGAAFRRALEERLRQRSLEGGQPLTRLRKMVAFDRFVRHANEFRQRLDYMHWNPVRKGFVQRPEEWMWSSYNNFAIDKKRIKECRIQINYARLSDSYRG